MQDNLVRTKEEIEKDLEEERTLISIQSRDQMWLASMDSLIKDKKLKEHHKRKIINRLNEIADVNSESIAK